MLVEVADDTIAGWVRDAVRRYLTGYEIDRELKPLVAAAVRNALAAEDIPAQVAAAVREHVASTVATTVQRRLDRRAADVAREQIDALELPGVPR